MRQRTLQLQHRAADLVSQARLAAVVVHGLCVCVSVGVGATAMGARVRGVGLVCAAVGAASTETGEE